MRTIEIDAYEYSLLVEAQERNYGEWLKAIGYLSSWALTAENPFPHVRIWLDKDLDLTACYYRLGEDGKPEMKPGYVICAVWNGERYGFHS